MCKILEKCFVKKGRSSVIKQEVLEMDLGMCRGNNIEIKYIILKYYEMIKEMVNVQRNKKYIGLFQISKIKYINEMRKGRGRSSFFNCIIIFKKDWKSEFFLFRLKEYYFLGIIVYNEMRYIDRYLILFYINILGF